MHTLKFRNSLFPFLYGTVRTSGVILQWYLTVRLIGHVFPQTKALNQTMHEVQISENDITCVKTKGLIWKLTHVSFTKINTSEA